MWWHLNYDTVITSEWATPSMLENGLGPEDLLGRRFGHHLKIWSMSERKLIQRIDLGDQHRMVLELRQVHDLAKAFGFVGVVISDTFRPRYARTQDGKWQVGFLPAISNQACKAMAATPSGSWTFCGCARSRAHALHQHRRGGRLAAAIPTKRTPTTTAAVFLAPRGYA